MARQETDAERAARKAAAQAFQVEQERKRQAGKLSGKQTFVRYQAEQAFDDRTQFPGAHGRKSHPRSSRTPKAIIDLFGKTIAPAKRPEWEVNTPPSPLAHPPHYTLHAIFDANVVLHAVGSDRIPCCEKAVELVEQHEITLCATPAIVDEVIGCAETSMFTAAREHNNLPRDDLYGLRGLGIRQEDLNKIRALFDMAEIRNLSYLHDELKIHSDPADVMYLDALRSFGKQYSDVVLVTRDREHLLSLKQSSIVHPGALLGLLRRHGQEK